MGTSDLDHAISVQKRHEARVKGYVGEACPECGDFYMVRRGTGLVCEKCGATTEGASPESELPVAAVARPTTDEIKEVFFKAMCAGYAGDGSEKTTISELPGSKVITFKEGLWLVTDVYFVSPGSNFSHGTTAIYHDGKIVWVMQYQGWYDPSVIPFLKQSLAINYEKSFWWGGRGPRFHDTHWEGKQWLSYRNHVKDNSFGNFYGFEEILDASANSRQLGYHYYRGTRYYYPH